MYARGNHLQGDLHERHLREPRSKNEEKSCGLPTEETTEDDEPVAHVISEDPHWEEEQEAAVGVIGPDVVVEILMSEALDINEVPRRKQVTVSRVFETTTPITDHDLVKKGSDG